MKTGLKHLPRTPADSSCLKQDLLCSIEEEIFLFQNSSLAGCCSNQLTRKKDALLLDGEIMHVCMFSFPYLRAALYVT